MKPQKLTKTEMERELAKQEGTVVLDFYADWCGPCKMLAPIYDEVAEETPDVFFGKINVAEEPEAAEMFSVRSVPSVLVFCKGKTVKRSTGFMKKDALRSMVTDCRL